ncbi:hypothetical protein CCAND95_300039 [Capnocytophaga canis]|nr:hypothetical protein CCAND95_300039 [Capnocytophaga canis]
MKIEYTGDKIKKMPSNKKKNNISITKK